VKTLGDINSFGGIDADTDFLLDECFEEHDSYLSARAGTKFLIVGRKGSGKTAIYRKLLRTKAYDIFSFGHTFRDYPWHHHDKQRKIGVPDHECYAHSWKYLILITLSRILINQDGSQPWSEGALQVLSSIENFIIDTYGTKDPDVSQVFQPSTKIKINAGFGFKAMGFEAKASPEIISMDRLPTIIQEINSNLAAKLIEALNPENKYFIMFDELDLGFSKVDDNYRLRLIGLIHAARDINISAKNAEKNLNVIVFLRDDIFQDLKFEDKNKIVEQGMSRIEWDSPRTTHTLKEIMSRRISKLLGCSVDDAWNIAFDEEQKMTGHQTKYQHIVDRTMLRPRDIIKFCNEILFNYRKSPDKSDKFNNLNVKDARSEYSQYLLSELEDEIFKHIPDHENVFELLRELEAVQFSFVEFEQICTDRKDLVPEGQTAKTVLAQLFEFSVVGYYQPGGGGYGGAEYIFRYKSPRAKFNYNALGYQVHLGLQAVLSLKRYRRTSPDIYQDILDYDPFQSDDIDSSATS